MKEQSEIDVLSGFTVDVANELRENIVNMEKSFKKIENLHH